MSGTAKSCPCLGLTWSIMSTSGTAVVRHDARAAASSSRTSAPPPQRICARSGHAASPSTASLPPRTRLRAEAGWLGARGRHG
eukprot:1274413-Rhodomonas_salina.1